MEELIIILIQRLEQKGIEPIMIYSFIRDLANTIGVNPSMNLIEVNKHLHLLGWDSFELDYRTLELATTCFKAKGSDRLENEPICYEINLKTVLVDKSGGI
jgi:hypothetical protein